MLWLMRRRLGRKVSGEEREVDPEKGAGVHGKKIVILAFWMNSFAENKKEGNIDKNNLLTFHSKRCFCLPSGPDR